MTDERRTGRDRRTMPRFSNERRRGHLAPPCPDCGSNSSTVYDSRFHAPHNSKHRRRACGECGTHFLSDERTVRKIPTKAGRKSSR